MLVLVFGFVLPQLADYRVIANYIQGIEPFEWLLLAVFAGWFLVAYVFVFMATLPSLHFREGFVVQTTATAINNSLPAGGAIALVENGDIIEIDIPNRSINVKLSDEELAALAEGYRLIHIRRTEARTGPDGPGELAWVWPVMVMMLLLRPCRHK